MNHKLRLLFPAMLCALWLVAIEQQAPVAAQSLINQAKITEILDGTQVFIQNKPAKVKDAANKGQRVRTADARVQLVFNTGAIGRLAQNSILTVGQCARLKQGTLLVNGAMNGCTASVVAGVRGTTYILEVTEGGEASIKVLEGEVTVTKLATPLAEESETDGSAGNKQLDADKEGAVVVAEGEQVSVSSSGVPGVVEKISQEEFTRLLQGGLFNGFIGALPGIGKIQQSFQRLFPRAPFPLSVPGLPSIPIPIRLPF
jgi:hypothetical protein